MASVRVTISRFTDEHFPGFVECLLVDVDGRTWAFNEKYPVVSAEMLGPESQYPREGLFDCTILRRRTDSAGRRVVTIDTSRPWGIESTEGTTVFDVFAEQLEDANESG